MDRHVLGLTDAEYTIATLVFDGRVPPTFEMDDVIGRRQRQSGAGSATGQITNVFRGLFGGVLDSPR